MAASIHPPDAALDNIEGYKYKEEVEMDEISVEEVKATIRGLGGYHAPGPSGIPNIAIKSVGDTIAPLLTNLSNSAMKFGYFPSSWKCFSTIRLHKPRKDNYSKPKAYCPIALEETLGKVIEAILATQLMHLAEVHNLLPANHFGGRPGRNTTDALLYLTQRIKDAWQRKKAVSTLFLNITQAFPTVSH